MAEQVQRKLAAIFAADVEGYSRLMCIDEVGTLRTLTNRSTPMADGENGVSGAAIGSVPPSPVWRSSREMPNCRAFCRAARRTPETRDCLAVGTVSSERLSNAARIFPAYKRGPESVAKHSERLTIPDSLVSGKITGNLSSELSSWRTRDRRNRLVFRYLRLLLRSRGHSRSREFRMRDQGSVSP